MASARLFVFTSNPSGTLCPSSATAKAWGKLRNQGQLIEDVEALDLLVQQGLYIDNSVFYGVLKQCVVQKDLFLGVRVHALAVSSGFESNAFLANHFICMYASHGRLEEAMQVFTKVPSPSRYMWSSIILAHARHGRAMEAISLYRLMRKSSLKLDKCLFVAVLTACASAQDLSCGKEVHADLLRIALKPDVVVGNCLVDMYSKCGSLEDARKVFDNLPTRDVVTWTTMIAGYAQHGLGQEALAMYAIMQQEGVTPANQVTFVCLLQACASAGALHHGKQLHAQIRERGLAVDVVVGTCLVDMYSKCGSLEDARRVFDNLPVKNVVTWNAMITGYVQHGLVQESLDTYRSMEQEGMSPADAVTFVCLLQACGSVAGLEKGREIHSQFSKMGFDATDLFLANALIDMYGKCGSMPDAHQIFDALPTRDIVTWSALIAGYARQGDSGVVFDLFQRMSLEGKHPNDVTFLSILTVCSHVGLVDEGQMYFEALSRDYGVTPTLEHYACMVDLLGRAGQLEKAVEMAETMPFTAPPEMWKSLLCACQKWSNVELGRRIFDSAVNFDRNDAAPYVLLSNIYKAAHMQEKAQEIKELQVLAQVWKKPGYSWWTDIEGVVHTFAVEDQGHPARQHVHSKLGDMVIKLKEEATC